ncbi:MAG: hypothetical protein ACRCX2_15645 [Paraclostridium sp.]
MKLEKGNTASIGVTDGEEILFGLQVQFINLDKLYKTDMESMLAFDIETKIQYKDYSTPYITMLQRSIFSNMFGLSSTDPKEVMEKRFRCSCGDLSGSVRYEECPNCHDMTDARSAIRGWMDLKSFRLLTPHYYSFLLKAINKSKITSFKGGSDNKTNKNEDMEEIEVDVSEERVKKKKRVSNNIQPYEWTVGDEIFSLHDLSNDNNLLSRFINLVVTRPDYRYVLLQNIEAATTSRIPVVSKGYRPHKLTQKLDKVIDVENHPLNKEYVSISSHIHKLSLLGENGSPYGVNRKLYNILCNWLKIMEIVNTVLGGGKKSDIRSRINARRLPNSARLVVELFIHPNIESIVLPYDTFGVIYAEEMFEHFGRRMSSMCQHRLKSGIPNVQDKLLMIEYLDFLKANDMDNVIVKRSPVIYEASIMSLKIIGLSNNRVLRISGQVMSEFSGDYDGDILALFVISDKSIRKQVHNALNPHIFAVDRFTNEFNPGMGLNDSSHIIAFKMLEDGFTCGT